MGFRRNRVRTCGFALLSICAGFGCDRRDRSSQIEPVYNRSTGRLEQLKYDRDGDGRIETWSFMDGTRIVRVEMDGDGDGLIDRWEYYDAGERLEKVGSSRGRTGVPDSWAYYDAGGRLQRLDLSMKQPGVVDRVEYYENGAMTRAQEDTNGDSRPDKWESYKGRRLSSVAFDTESRGTPDRRLVYEPDGDVRVERLGPDGQIIR